MVPCLAGGREGYPLLSGEEGGEEERGTPPCLPGGVGKGREGTGRREGGVPPVVAMGTPPLPVNRHL